MRSKRHTLLAGILILFGVIAILIFALRKIDKASTLASTEESTDISHPGPAHVVSPPNMSAIMEDYEYVSSFTFKESFVSSPSTHCYLSYKNGMLSLNIYRQTPNEYTISINDSDFQNFVEIFKKYHVFEWRPSVEYWDLEKGRDALNFIPNPDAEYLKMGNFYCVGNGNDNELYMGLSGDEKLARNMYTSEWDIEIENKNYSYIKQYQSYGVPENYNEFREELWDFALKLLDAPDWREEIDKNAGEGLIKQYPSSLGNSINN